MTKPMDYQKGQAIRDINHLFSNAYANLRRDFYHPYSHPGCRCYTDYANMVDELARAHHRAVAEVMWS